MLWEEHKLVNTSFASLPIMSNLDTILGQLNQDYLDGKIKNYADILPMWEEEAIKIMKEFGYRNLITGKLPN